MKERPKSLCCKSAIEYFRDITENGVNETPLCAKCHERCVPEVVPVEDYKQEASGE